MKIYGLIEILGVFVIVTGAGFGIAAAALVSVALACVVTSLFLLAAGITIIYVAAALEVAEPPAVKAKADA